MASALLSLFRQMDHRDLVTGVITQIGPGADLLGLVPAQRTEQRMEAVGHRLAVTQHQDETQTSHAVILPALVASARYDADRR